MHYSVWMVEFSEKTQDHKVVVATAVVAAPVVISIVIADASKCAVVVANNAAVNQTLH